MLPMIRTLMTVARRVKRIHHAAIDKPHKHKALMAGHVLELAALAIGAFDYTLAEHVTGVAGAGLLLYHVLVNEA